MRKTLPVIAAVGAVLLLAGCTSGGTSPTPSPTAPAASAKCPSVPSGSLADSVKVTGDFQKKPTVKFRTPMKASGFQRSVLISGHGSRALPEKTVDIALAAYNGTTGKQISSQGFNGSATLPITIDKQQVVPGVLNAIECLPVGSRAVLTASAGTAFGQGDPSQLGLKKTDSIVFVADVVRVLPDKADGTPQKVTEKGLPTVSLAKDGTPKVTIPKTDPPKTTTVVDLKKGDGPTVKSGDMVTMQYQGLVWRTGKIFDQSWGRAPLSGPTTGFVKGFQKALVGQKVGSQVLVTIPPADGYGKKGNSQAGIKGTDTIVFVIDILQTVTG